MVVNCPNCDTPNDADMERCQSCNARIPMSLRRRAMVPKQQARKQRAEYDEPDEVTHHADRRSVMHKTSNDSIGRRTDARSLRRDLKPSDTGMPTSSSPEQKYAPPPTTGAAARSSSGRSYVDSDGYRSSVGQGQSSPQAPNQPVYANRAAWQQQYQDRVDPTHTRQAQRSSAQSDPNDALQAHQQQQGPASPQHSVQQQPQSGGGQGYPQSRQEAEPGQAAQKQRPDLKPTVPGGQQSFSASGPGGQFSYSSSGRTSAQQRQEYGNSVSSHPDAGPGGMPETQRASVSEIDTQRAMAAAGTANPDQSLQLHQAQHDAPAPPSRRAQPYAQASEELRANESAPSGADDSSATKAMTGVPSPGSYGDSRPEPQRQPPQVDSGLSRPMTGESVIRDDSSAPKPRPKRKPRAILVFIGNDGKPRERLPLSLGKTVIGRTEGEVLLTNDPYVSPWHAQVTVNKAGVTIKDMYSLNGIFKRIPRQAILEDSDRFIIGNQVLKFRHGWDAPRPDKQGTRLLGGTNPSSPARVFVMTASEEVAGLTPIRDVLTIGRSGCDLSIPEDSGLADKHAQIQWDGQNFLLIDLNSPTGVFLNIRGEATLADGDMIQIGRQRMMIDLPSQES